MTKQINIILTPGENWTIKMTALAILASLTGFYLLYNTSARADVRKDKVSLWFQRRPLLAKITGLLILITGFVVFVIDNGFGVGMLFGFVALMTSGSLIVLLSPLINNKTSNARE